MNHSVETTTPALQKLEEDHVELVAAIRGSFDSIDDVLDWIVRANVRTLGQLPADFYLRMVKDRLSLTALLDAPIGDCPYSEGGAEFRRNEYSSTVSTACRQAYRVFRESAGEHFDEFEHLDIQADNVALRPVLQETEERQRDVLLRGRDGFESREALDDWYRDANAAAFGEIHGDVNAYALFDWDTAALLDNPGEPNVVRDSVVLDELMPPFVRAVRLLRERANEQVSEADSPPASNPAGESSRKTGDR